MLIVLIGCHGAGKTSLGSAAARALGWTFHDELGRWLAAQPSHRTAHETAASPQAAFDERLMELELARDERWVPSMPRIIETWHPGNLAYASCRGSTVGAHHMEAIERSCRRQPILVQPLLARAETLRTRQSEPGPHAFFLRVASASLRCAEQLRLPILPPLWTDDEPIEALARELAERWQRVASTSARRAS